ncbi:MAG: serine/threonine protein kinase, partial [Pseudonocardiales bacterium]|nr:serine/threonine protein kinase [Pseudonocardiales bacterium]
MQAGTRIGDRYELTYPVGRGGMGEVWAGYDEKLDRPVAIKVL